MDKFLIAENPQRPEDSGLWVIHLLDPVAIIQCIEGHADPGRPYAHFSFRNPDGVVEEWTLSAWHFFTADFITEPEDQVQPLLKRAWRWFRSYLKWEDNNIDEDEEASRS